MAQTEKVGDKSYYEVRGNVKMISYEDEYTPYDVEFNKEGQSLCLGYTKTRKKGNTVEYIVPNDVIDEEVTTYDNKGRLIKHQGFEFYIRNMKYDDSDNLIYYESGGYWGDESETRTYDSLGYCCKKIKKVQELGEETGKTNTYTYTILQKDAKGNWTKRKRNDGKVESRKIYYY
jgi:hypothetical protein